MSLKVRQSSLKWKVRSSTSSDVMKFDDGSRWSEKVTRACDRRRVHRRRDADDGGEKIQNRFAISEIMRQKEAFIARRQPPPPTAEIYDARHQYAV